jgi:hypothetical protein
MSNDHDSNRDNETLDVNVKEPGLEAPVDEPDQEPEQDDDEPDQKPDPEKPDDDDDPEAQVDAPEEVSAAAVEGPRMTNHSPPGPWTLTITRLAGPGALDATEQVETTWPQWLDHLERSSPGDDGGVEHAGWSPVLYDPPRRTQGSVRRVFGLVFDHDAGSDWERVCTLWKPYYGLIYTLHSSDRGSTPTPRLRVVLPTTRSLSLEEHDVVSHWVDLLAARADCPVDPRSHDATRFWAEPNRAAEGWRCERLLGRPFEPDGIGSEVEAIATRALGERTPSRLAEAPSRACVAEPPPA